MSGSVREEVSQHSVAPCAWPLSGEGVLAVELLAQPVESLSVQTGLTVRVKAFFGLLVHLFKQDTNNVVVTVTLTIVVKELGVALGNQAVVDIET